MSDPRLLPVAKAICAASGDEWSREGPRGLMHAYGPLAEAALRAADEAGWQPIETAPRDGAPVLLAALPNGNKTWRYGVGCYSANDILWDWPWTFPPTAWRPLPPGPQEGR